MPLLGSEQRAAEAADISVARLFSRSWLFCFGPAINRYIRSFPYFLQRIRGACLRLREETLQKQKNGELFQIGIKLDDLVINTAMNQVNYVGG